MKYLHVKYLALLESCLLRISLYFKLMLSFSFMRFMFKPPLITMFDIHVEYLKIKRLKFFSQSCLALSSKFG